MLEIKSCPTHVLIRKVMSDLTYTDCYRNCRKDGDIAYHVRLIRASIALSAGSFISRIADKIGEKSMLD